MTSTSNEFCLCIPTTKIADHHILALSSLLRGYTPADSGVDWIDANTTALDAELSAIDNQLSRLNHRRILVAQQLMMHKAALAPIRSLPNDVLLYIFILAASEPTDSTNMLSPPWSLSHVCALWRTLALSSSPLWSTLIIDCSDHVPRSQSIVQAYLSRSRHYPLTIGLTCLDDIDPQCSCSQCIPYSLDVFGLILPECYRWRALELRTRKGYVDLLECVRGKTPLLEEMYLYVGPDNELYHWTESWDTPRLRRADLRSTAYAHRLLSQSSVITHFAATMEGIVDVMVIAQLQSLIECHVTLPSTYLDGLAVGELPHPVVQPSLERIWVNDIVIIGVLTTPNLHILSPEGTSFPESAYLPILSSFIERSNCSLRTLNLQSAPLATTVFHLSYFHHVEHFFVTFEDESPNAALFQELSTNSQVLPSLRLFKMLLRCETSLNSSWIEAVVGMFERRTAGSVDDGGNVAQITEGRLYCDKGNIENIRAGGLDALVDRCSPGLRMGYFDTDFSWPYFHGPYWLDDDL